MAKKNLPSLSGCKLAFEIRMLRKEMNDRFTLLEDRLDRLIGRVDAFLRVHYALHGIKCHEGEDKTF